MFKSHCSTGKFHNDNTWNKECHDSYDQSHHNDWDDKYSHCWDTNRYDNDDWCDKSYEDKHCHDGSDHGTHGGWNESTTLNGHHVYN